MQQSHYGQHCRQDGSSFIFIFQPWTETHLFKGCIMRISSFFVLDALHISLDSLNFCLCRGLFHCFLLQLMCFFRFFPVFLAFLAVYSSLHLVTFRLCSSLAVCSVLPVLFWRFPSCVFERLHTSHLPSVHLCLIYLLKLLHVSLCFLYLCPFALASVVKVRLWLVLLVSVSHAHFSSTLAWFFEPFCSIFGLLLWICLDPGLLFWKFGHFK